MLRLLLLVSALAWVGCNSPEARPFGQAGAGGGGGESEGGGGGDHEPPDVPPTLRLTTPAPGAFYGTATLLVEGVASDDEAVVGIRYVLNTFSPAEVEIEPGVEVAFSFEIEPRIGLNQLVIFAEDAGGAITTLSVEFQSDGGIPTPPVIVDFDVRPLELRAGEKVKVRWKVVGEGPIELFLEPYGDVSHLQEIEFPLERSRPILMQATNVHGMAQEGVQVNVVGGDLEVHPKRVVLEPGATQLLWVANHPTTARYRWADEWESVGPSFTYRAPEEEGVYVVDVELIGERSERRGSTVVEVRKAEPTPWEFETIARFLPPPVGFVADAQGRHWLFTGDGPEPLVRFEPELNRFLPVETGGLPQGNPIDLALAPDGSPVLLTTLPLGVHRLVAGAWQDITPAELRSGTALLRGAGGQLYVQGGGPDFGPRLLRFVAEPLGWELLPIEERFNGAHIDADGTVWLGTSARDGKNLIRIAEGAPPERLAGPAADVLRLLVDGRGDLWAAGNRAVYRLTDDGWIQPQGMPGGNTPFISALGRGRAADEVLVVIDQVAGQNRTCLIYAVRDDAAELLASIPRQCGALRLDEAAGEAYVSGQVGLWQIDAAGVRSVEAGGLPIGVEPTRVLRLPDGSRILLATSRGESAGYRLAAGAEMWEPVWSDQFPAGTTLLAVAWGSGGGLLATSAGLYRVTSDLSLEALPALDARLFVDGDRLGLSSDGIVIVGTMAEGVSGDASRAHALFPGETEWRQLDESRGFASLCLDSAGRTWMWSKTDGPAVLVPQERRFVERGATDWLDRYETSRVVASANGGLWTAVPGQALHMGPGQGTFEADTSGLPPLSVPRIGMSGGGHPIAYIPSGRSTLVYALDASRAWTPVVELPFWVKTIEPGEGDWAEIASDYGIYRIRRAPAPATTGP